MSVRQRPTPTKQPSTSATATATAVAVPESNNTGGSPQPQPQPQPQPVPPSSLQRRALSQTLTSTANLANLLPTGTLLAFQLLTPVFTNNGSCDSVTRLLTSALLLLLAFSCFLACFTDTVQASDGQVYHGLATFKGLWLFDYSDPSGAGLPDLRKYKVRFIDWVHAVLTVMVFFTVALRDRNVLSCFYPKPGQETQQVLDIVPVGIGLMSSLLFVVFPTTRHGIGYPLAPAT